MVKSSYSMPEKREKEELMENQNNETPLEEQSLCPAGEEYTEAVEEPEQEAILPEETAEEALPIKKKWSRKKIAKLVLAIVAGVLVLALIAGILVLALRKNDISYKEKYVASDFWANAAHDQVVATLGDYKLTNGQLQVFYWMQVFDMLNYYTEQYGDYAVYYLGIDLSKPLNEQVYDKETGMTWEQYFLEDALFAWHRYQALADEAKNAGYQLPGEYQTEFAGLKDSMEASAEKEGFESVDAMLQADLGSTVTFEDYYYYLELYYTGNLYFSEVKSQLTFTKEELDAFYKENKEMLEQYGVSKDSGNLVDFRNIMVKPVSSKDADGNTVYTDQAWADCLEKANAIFETWKNGEQTEAAFAALATQKSEDKESAANGGLYQYIAKNDMAVVDVRHILIMPEGGTKDDNGSAIYSEAEWEACRVSAQAILDQYLAGEQTEAAFATLANEHSQDNNGKVTNGGLYSDVSMGDMVRPFEKWIFDGSRKTGDTDLVKTQYGYHVMYFVERRGPVDAWAFEEGRKAGDTALIKTSEGYQIVYYVTDVVAWEAWCEDGLRSEEAEELMQSYAKARSLDVRYWAIMLSDRPEAES